MKMLHPHPQVNGFLFNLREVHEKYLLEQDKYFDVITSEHYKDLQSKLDDIKAEMDEMTTGLESEKETYNALKNSLKKVLKRLNITQLEGCRLELQQRKEVNKERLLRTLGGDMDNFLILTTVTQVALKEFAKTQPENEKDLLDCIESAGEEVVDIELLPLSE